MGFIQLSDAGGYHHAIVLSPAAYARHMFAVNITTDKSYWQSEDSAWHLATQLMSRYSNLTVLGFRASFPITPEVWTDALRLSACFFSQASRIILLVPSDAEEHFKTFTQTCLVPLLTRTEEDGGRPDWRDRFVAAVIGNVPVPSQLAPGIPFIKVVRFREISWLRDITAMMLLQRAIQEFWIPSKLKPGKSISYGSGQWPGYSLSETIETKSTVGMITQVNGQMESMPEVGRSKSVESRRSSVGRRKLPTEKSRSRSRSRRSTSSGYRSLDPEFEARQIEETIVNTRVINLLNECESIYLRDPPSETVLTKAETATVTDQKDASKLTETREVISSETNKVKNASGTEESATRLADANPTKELHNSDYYTKLLRVETEELESISKDDKMLAVEPVSPLHPVEVGQLFKKQDNSVSVKLEMGKQSDVGQVISTDSTYQADDTSTTSGKTDIPSVKMIDDSVHRLSRQASFSSTNDVADGSPEIDLPYNAVDHTQQFTELKSHTRRVSKTSSTLKTSRKLNVLMVDKVAEGVNPSTLNESVGQIQHSTVLISRVAERVKPDVLQSPLLPKTSTGKILSQTVDKSVIARDSFEKLPIPYIDSIGAYNDVQSVVKTPPQLSSVSSYSNENLKPGEEIVDKCHAQRESIDVSVPSITAQRSPSPSRIHYWSVVNTPRPPVPPKPDYVLPTKNNSDTTTDLKISEAKTEASSSEIASKPVKSFLLESVIMPVKLATSESVCTPTKPEEVSVVSSTDKSTDSVDKNQNDGDKDEPDNQQNAILSVFHNIPIVLKPNLNQATRDVPSTEKTGEPASVPELHKLEPSTSHPILVRVGHTETVDPVVDSSLYETKWHTSYMRKIVKREHTIDKRTKTETKRINRSDFSHSLFDDDNDYDANGELGDHDKDETDSVYQMRSLPVRARSTTPEKRSGQQFLSRSYTISSPRESFAQGISKSTVTPSGRVLYVRSAAPNRISSGDFGFKKTQRTYSSSQFRLAEPSVLTHSSPASPVLHARPRVHIYPSPWRSIASDKLADASSQMSGPLASGYMAGCGVTCYAFTGIYYDKPILETPKLVLCKDTSVWTGPDAAETFRLEVMFASRTKTMYRNGQSAPNSPVQSNVDGLDVVDSKSNALNAAVRKETPDQSPNQNEIIKLDQSADWWPVLFYAISCFVALITMIVAYFCSRSDREDNHYPASGFWTWFRSVTRRFRFQQDELH